MGSSAPPTSCSPARSSSSPATAGAAPGLAMRARGMGAHVIVTEVEPVRALEAVMDGYRVMPMKDAAKEGDLFVTVTGDINVVDEPHLQAMKSGAILANSGHFNDEINLSALDGMAESVRTIRPSLEEYRLRDGRKLFVLGEGRLVNLAAGEGHPAAVLDTSFGNQALKQGSIDNQTSQ